MAIVKDRDNAAVNAFYDYLKGLTAALSRSLTIAIGYSTGLWLEAGNRPTTCTRSPSGGRV
jgi:hypothetical protein